MPYYRVAGEVPAKRHIRFRGPDGSLYAEELMGEEGFVSDSSLLYHRHPPTAIVKSEGLADVAAEAPLAANHPLLPRHFRTRDLPAGGDMVVGRQLLLANSDEIESKIAAGNGRVARLIKEKKPIKEAIEELYLAACSRYPRSEELDRHLGHVAQLSNKQQALEDVLWAILNTREFLFNH